MKRILFIGIYLLFQNLYLSADCKSYDIKVDKNGKGDFTSIGEAIKSISSFDSKKIITIFICEGFYKEKLELPVEACNIRIVGESRDKTIISYDDYASKNDMGTFRTYTFLVRGKDITLENLTIENSAGEVGQAVALHTEGDRLIFRNCRFLGNQDTIFTGYENSRLYFEDCHIEGTTDFIFGLSTAWFENCDLHCKRKSYITASSTPVNVQFGYIFNNCVISIEKDVSRVYLGRPWRPYAMVLFMNCYLPEGIAQDGWHNWRNPDNEKTARYMEYNNSGVGADVSKRVGWIKVLTKEEIKIYTVKSVMKGTDNWNPLDWIKYQ